MKWIMAARNTKALCAILVFGMVAVAVGREDPADRDILNAVETIMRANEEVPAHWIDVSVRDGIVMLEGRVHNLLAKHKATDIAGKVKGVRSVVNRIDVRPVERDDARIRDDLVMALATDPVAHRYAIKARVDDGIVSLFGAVSEHAEKELCAEIAKGVRGVREVDNNITVEFVAERTDAEIEGLVQRLLESDVRIDAALVDVDVEDGRVMLSGNVGSEAKRSAAISTAWVLGVRDVDAGDLSVAWWKRDRMVRADHDRIMSDSEIEVAIGDALAEDPRVWGFDVDVHSDDRSVVLRGTVDNLRAKRVAEEIAGNTMGVLNVVNHLRVRPEPIISDAEIIDSIQASLERDPYLEPFDITVISRNGLVMLYGIVNTHHEKRQAESLAGNVRGVVDVRNHLDVREARFGRSDEALEADIRQRFRWNPLIEGDRVEVDVSDGVATLSGVVLTREAYEEAARIARDAGTQAIVNRLEIR